MNDQIVEMYERHPLMAFSPLMHWQVTELLALGDEIKQSLAACLVEPPVIDGPALTKASARLWLWILGAYEVLRTMSQASHRFTDEVAQRITEEKQYFAQVRMPLAKHEFARRKEPSGSAGFLSGVDAAAKDVSFDIRGERYSARAMIQQFSNLVSSIKLSDMKQFQRDQQDAPGSPESKRQ